MRKIETDILVIGGGATGTGLARDLAMRGFRTTLVEKRDLSHGTTGRYHGLLHSGGRYVVKDPQAARECIQENKILRQIMPHCIEDTGGFFVLTPFDDPNYIPLFLTGCRSAGIPVEEISIAQMLKEEPYLNPQITHCFRVPDAAADSFLASESNAASAKEHGAQILTYHEIIFLMVSKNCVTGAVCHDLINDEQVLISAAQVVNASGAWAGKIASLAGIKLNITPGKGTMVALNHRILNTVVNRCKMPSDGDIIVPIHSVAVIGTTDIQVADPDKIAIEPWEIRLMLTEGEKLIPGIKNMRVLRAWAGVRPLYQEGSPIDSRYVSRAYVLIDHEERDGIAGFITITSGKWTTFRLMAEVTADLVCQKLGTFRPCRTHLEPLPGGQDGKFHHVSSPLAKVEKAKAYGSLYCECELVTREEIQNAIKHLGAKTLDDIRRDTRLGMGPCQGGFCTIRAVGLLHSVSGIPSNRANNALLDFLQERWKGVLPILWGAQLRQARLDEFIFAHVLNAAQLPGERETRLSPEPYLRPSEPIKTPQRPQFSMSGPPQISNGEQLHPFSHAGSSVDVIVIGGGLAGLTAAWQASCRGKKVRLITKGWGTPFWSTGCIDVLGYDVISGDLYHAPLIGIEKIQHSHPTHPYARLGVKWIESALDAIKHIGDLNGYPLTGCLEGNLLLPTALGTTRPTCIAPETMVAGDLRSPEPLLIVGFSGYQDFFPGLIAENLCAQGFTAREVTLTLPTMQNQRYFNAITLARLFETDSFRMEVIEHLRSHLGDEPRIGFPAVLGMEKSSETVAILEHELNRRIFEIAGLPPSVPGMRLQNILHNAVKASGGQVFPGMEVLSAEIEGQRIITVRSEAAARTLLHKAEKYVLATGGILGGGFVSDVSGQVIEPIFRLTVFEAHTQGESFQSDFLDPNGHPLFNVGLKTDDSLHLAAQDGSLIFENLYVCGAALDGGQYIQEKSYEGVALATGFFLGKEVL